MIAQQQCIEHFKFSQPIFKKMIISIENVRKNRSEVALFENVKILHEAIPDVNMFQWLTYLQMHSSPTGSVVWQGHKKGTTSFTLTGRKRLDQNDKVTSFWQKREAKTRGIRETRTSVIKLQQLAEDGLEASNVYDNLDIPTKAPPKAGWVANFAQTIGGWKDAVADFKQYFNLRQEKATYGILERTQGGQLTEYSKSLMRGLDLSSQEMQTTIQTPIYLHLQITQPKILLRTPMER